MAQKTKVKELVGRGLHSYHTKTLQQMDRIEKKNKEQNHKISILSNELDNDYLTKTEEGSVVSLEHSKEGMVYLDELQGNTLVNYCTDGSKEMTLNGDIDVEGVSVTTTEGVDNGKIDVMCEGNTLVNLIKNNGAFTVTKVDGQSYRQYDVPLVYPLKANTTYTIYLTVESNAYDHLPFSNIVIGQGDGDSWSNRIYWNKEFGKNNSDKGLGRHKATFTTHSRVEETSHKWIKFIFESYAEFNTTIKDIVLIQGEHNENIDNFVGMKSVGQDDTNGHKIEILSRNKNLFNINDFEFNSVCSGVDLRIEGQEIVLNGTSTSSYTRHSFVNYLDYMKDKTTYTLSGDYMLMETTYNDGRQTWKKQITTDKSNMKKVTVYLQWLEPNVVFDNLRIRPMLEEGSVATTYVTPSLNKKEISLNAPLRKINANYMDKVVKISNKFYKEKNCEEILSTDYTWSTSASNTFETCKVYAVNIPNLKAFDAIGVICDKLPVYSAGTLLSNNPQIAIALRRGANSGLLIRLPIDTDITTYINENPFKVVVPLLQPNYEEVNSFELSTYNDITHISNNSIIPCNMKIKNSGYNAIIKPSTLYTVALDTNKSGTIGMNLGGAKGTTTNNVLKLTTPATLTDDSLRLYGKGIKGSKVRLLEGDKTNWIPSHFEGMKSSFEDKFDATDNTYKMEILSNNINLVDYENIGYKSIPTNEFTIKGDKITLNSSKTYQALYYHIPVKRGEDYIVSCKNITNGNVLIYDTKVQGHHADKFKLSIGKNTVKARITPKSDYITLRVSVETMVNTDCTFEQLMMHRANVSSEFKFNKFNKIQFSSIEPLRGVGNIKDKFVFKDNKLMIERNCGEVVLNGNENYWQGCSHSNVDNIKYLRYYTNNDIGVMANSTLLCDKFNNNLNKGTIVFMNSASGSFPNGIQFQIHPSSGCIDDDMNSWKQWLQNNPTTVAYQLKEPTYEEIPFELQKIILEGYENGTLFFDTNIPPTSTVTYAGETPIVKSVRLNKTEVLSNTEDINDNIIPYLMDMDYRVVMLQLATEELEGGVSMARLFGGAYEMLKRDILSKRLTRQEYGYRLADYFNAGKLTEEQVRELEDLR